MAREYVLQPFRPPVNLQIDYANELNSEQLAAVEAAPGPALVIAGAGAGKTRTLTYRVAWLLEQGIPADRILLLTFTNKAAKEMMQRVRDLLGTELRDLWGGTFHGIGNRILRRHADVIGFGRDFSILDSEDARDLLKHCIADLNIDKKATRFPKTEVIAGMFSRATNVDRPIGQVASEEYGQFDTLVPVFEKLYKDYAGRKKTANSMDFDDLLALWLRLFKEQPEVCETYQRRFQFILVDEYQDTNRIQGELIDLIAERHQNVMAVGDDSQSIYGWRGANFRNIIEFPDRYAKAAVYKIETNYRSTPEILELANAAIASNIHQFEKRLKPVKPAGEKPGVVACGDANVQAAFIAQRINELYGEDKQLSDIAVLYRSHFHALELQLELTRRNIPFSITSGIRFFEQAHIKDVTAYLKFVFNPRDEVAFKRIVLMLPGVGAKGADKLWNAFYSKLPTSGHPADIAAELGSFGKSVPKKAQTGWKQLVETIRQLEDSETVTKPARMIQIVVEAGYEDYAEDAFQNPAIRIEELEQLANFAIQFGSNEEFLAQLALLTNLEVENTKERPDDEDRVRLSTIHQAKGLEFDVVFVIMLCDGLFPSHRSLDDPEGEEEERRLFYVAVTRAREQLYLSWPRIRLGQGYGDIFQSRSRFLAELPPHTFEDWELDTSAIAY